MCPVNFAQLTYLGVQGRETGARNGKKGEKPAQKRARPAQDNKKAKIGYGVEGVGVQTG